MRTSFLYRHVVPVTIDVSSPFFPVSIHRFTVGRRGDKLDGRSDGVLEGALDASLEGISDHAGGLALIPPDSSSG